MAVNHTPGPWHYQENADAYTHIVRDAENRYIAGFSQYSSGNAEADARLCAAAPKLLEACKDALAFLDRPDITTPEWYKLAPEHVAKFRQAIAEAEGQ